MSTSSKSKSIMKILIFCALRSNIVHSYLTFRRFHQRLFLKKCIYVWPKPDEFQRPTKKVASFQKHFPLSFVTMKNQIGASAGNAEEMTVTALPNDFVIPEGCPLHLPLPDVLHQFLSEIYPSMSRARKAIRKGKVTLNGKRGRCGDGVVPGDMLSFGAGWQSKRKTKRRDQLRVIHEDDWMAVVDKPTGVSVHGHGGHSLAPNLPDYLQPSTQEDALEKLQPCHRLDAPTGGLLVVAKTKSALRHLCAEFEFRRAKKRYSALVVGKLEGKGRITDSIDDKEALTIFEAKNHTRSSEFGWLTTVELFPETGRKHQLRQHLAGINHPILGDMRYCRPGFFKEMHGLFLWATHLSISHPYNNVETVFELEQPPKMCKAINHHQRQYLKKYDLSDVKLSDDINDLSSRITN
mmetsp:Transcript_3510/g.4557  ORF Transcript_3510/g.4557 Transcript_3510/m.4557 type:complete len:408 (-) Transcript_3510:90-1313(-)